MWIITDEPILFNTDSGHVIDFGWSHDVQTYCVYLNDSAVYQCFTSRDAIDYIRGLAQLLGAVSVPMPPVEADDKPEPF